MEDRAASGKMYEAAMEKWNFLNGNTQEERPATRNTPVKVADFQPTINVIEADDYEADAGWTEELVQAALNEYGVEPGYDSASDPSAERGDVVLNPPGDFYERSGWGC